LHGAGLCLHSFSQVKKGAITNIGPKIIAKTIAKFLRAAAEKISASSLF
jgi:hypothetical protein